MRKLLRQSAWIAIHGAWFASLSVPIQAYADRSGGRHHHRGHYAQVPQVQYALMAAQYANATKNYLDLQKQDQPRIQAANDAQQAYQDARAELEKAFDEGTLHSEDRAEVENLIHQQLNGTPSGAPQASSTDLNLTPPNPVPVSSPAASGGAVLGMKDGGATLTTSPSTTPDPEAPFVGGASGTFTPVAGVPTKAAGASSGQSGSGNSSPSTQTTVLGASPILAADGSGRIDEKLDALSQSLIRTAENGKLGAGLDGSEASALKSTTPTGSEDLKHPVQIEQAKASTTDRVSQKLAALVKKARAFFSRTGPSGSEGIDLRDQSLGRELASAEAAPSNLEKRSGSYQQAMFGQEIEIPSATQSEEHAPLLTGSLAAATLVPASPLLILGYALWRRRRKGSKS